MSALPVPDADARSHRPAPPPPLQLRPAGGGSAPLAPAPRRHQEPPDPRVWAGSLVRLVAEVITGNRDAAHLRRWVEPEVYEGLARRGGLYVRLHGRPARRTHARPLSVHLTRTPRGDYHLCAVVDDGRRVRALSGRFHLLGHRWEAVELDVG
ncbi:Rv3235 family protein [Serinibacter salmoneus]|uniref:Uncharacterized protein n=1 Tax=Serinibacter salmoneus TaxID=556530 RepID=A0A2A9D0W4_9MICO|nr:Rv3235 family protein [Serinibacter salmoneus]PFG20327.1 hypothetical protein ATL40_1925 [Serinibacter salmoneus]